jgi:hypothetical protein
VQSSLDTPVVAIPLGACSQIDNEVYMKKVQQMSHRASAATRTRTSCRHKKACDSRVVHKKNAKYAHVYACGRKISENCPYSISWRLVTCKQCRASQMLSSPEVAVLIPFSAASAPSPDIASNDRLGIVRMRDAQGYTYAVIGAAKVKHAALADLLDANIAVRVKAWKLYGKPKGESSKKL